MNENLKKIHDYPLCLGVTKENIEFGLEDIKAIYVECHFKDYFELYGRRLKMHHPRQKQGLYEIHSYLF